MSLSTLAAIALAAAVTPAFANIWSADYDPPAFIGTALFDVPTPCLSGVPDGEYLQTDFPGCSPIRILDNVSTTPAINFAAVLPSSAILSYDVIGGQFVGVDTAKIGSVTVGLTNYWFEFVSTFTPADGVGASVTNVVNLYANCSTGDGISCGPPVNVATIVRFAAVPEPGSLGLLLGALGAGWLARRRKAG